MLNYITEITGIVLQSIILQSYLLKSVSDLRFPALGSGIFLDKLPIPAKYFHVSTFLKIC